MNTDVWLYHEHLARVLNVEHKQEPPETRGIAISRLKT